MTPRMSAGRLRHRITFQERFEAQDSETGAVTPTWVDVVGWVNIPAEVAPLNIREMVQAQTINSKTTTRITIRYRPGIDATWRILYRDQIFNSEGGFTDPDSGLDYWVIPCSTGSVNADG